jgi:hypothetical protein
MPHASSRKLVVEKLGRLTAIAYPTSSALIAAVVRMRLGKLFFLAASLNQVYPRKSQQRQKNPK